MMENIYKSVTYFTLVFVLSFSTQTFAQQKDSLVSTEEQLAESVKLAPCESKERLEAVKALFEKVGAKKEDVLIEQFDKDKIANVVVRKKGKTDETIIIGAHYDKTVDGCGAIDNWTGISIIAHLYKTISQIETEKSYIFVAFDKEEKGLYGSDAMAKAIPKEKRSQYCAMVNLDSFGLALPQALQSASDSELILIAKKLAKESGFTFDAITIEGADADSSSFKKRNISAITFSGLDANWQKYLHTSDDKLKNINMKSVHLGYRFVLSFTATLDKMPCALPKK
jgi:Zn-dependent M28 family amino/carboxypeptidase